MGSDESYSYVCGGCRDNITSDRPPTERIGTDGKPFQTCPLCDEYLRIFDNVSIGVPITFVAVDPAIHARLLSRRPIVTTPDGRSVVFLSDEEMESSGDDCKP